MKGSSLRSLRTGYWVLGTWNPFPVLSTKYQVPTGGGR